MDEIKGILIDDFEMLQRNLDIILKDKDKENQTEKE